MNFTYMKMHGAILKKLFLWSNSINCKKPYFNIRRPCIFSNKMFIGFIYFSEWTALFPWTAV